MRFGKWQIKEPNTDYVAETDGFVVSNTHVGDDENLPEDFYPTRKGVKVKNRSISRRRSPSGVIHSFTFPVRKGDSWNVEGASNTDVQWLPLVE